MANSGQNTVLHDTVFYDGDCGFCAQCIRLLRLLDWAGRLRYATLQGAEAGLAGIQAKVSASEMVFRSKPNASRPARNWGGWRAVKQVLLRLPVFYLGFATTALVSLWLTAFLALLLSPLGNRTGDALYRWVARNRHRLPGTTCHLENR